MSTQPKALQLADALERHPGGAVLDDAATELRRLHAANLDCVDYFNAVKAERDELLEALRQISDYARKDGDIIAQHLGGVARDAIAKALEQAPAPAVQHLPSDDTEGGEV